MTAMGADRQNGASSGRRSAWSRFEPTDRRDANGWNRCITEDEDLAVELPLRSATFLIWINATSLPDCKLAKSSQPGPCDEVGGRTRVTRIAHHVDDRRFPLSRRAATLECLKWVTLRHQTRPSRKST